MSEVSGKKAENQRELAAIDAEYRRRQKLLQQTQNSELQKIRDQHEGQKAALKQDNYAAINHIRLGHQKEVKSEDIKHRGDTQKQKLQHEQDYQRLAMKAREQQQTIAIAAENEKRRLEAQKNYHREVQARQQQAHAQNLQKADEQNLFMMREREEKARENYRTFTEHHNQEMAQRINQRETMIKNQHHKFASQERKQKVAHQQQLEHEQQHFETLRKRQEDHYQQKVKGEKGFYQNQLADQYKNYRTHFDQNNVANKGSLENQKNRYEEALFDIRKNFVHNAKFYENRAFDPFYQLLDLDAQFIEGEGFYEIRARIPEHEMENFKVHVQPEEITLFAARKHEQEFRNSNEKVSSNNNQTVKQQFSLPQPAEHEQATKSYINGELVVKVPKKGFSPLGFDQGKLKIS